MDENVSKTEHERITTLENQMDYVIDQLNDIRQSLTQIAQEDKCKCTGKLEVQCPKCITPHGTCEIRKETDGKNVNDDLNFKVTQMDPKCDYLVQASAAWVEGGEVKLENCKPHKPEEGKTGHI